MDQEAQHPLKEVTQGRVESMLALMMMERMPISEMMEKAEVVQKVEERRVEKVREAREEKVEERLPSVARTRLTRRQGSHRSA